MTASISSLLASGEKDLRKYGIAASDALPLLMHALHRDAAFLLSHGERLLSPSEISTFQQLIQKRIAGYSVAVILGRKFFFGLEFKVTTDTLVPRPETELMVEIGLEFLSEHGRSAILDMGTGSGNIIISLAKTAGPRKHTYVACDTSSAALTVAKENAKRHRVPVVLYKSNLFNSLPSGRFNLVLANLPYLATHQMYETSIAQEPHDALWGGDDGTGIYAKLLPQLPKRLRKEFCVALEYDPSQTKKLRQLAERAFPNSRIEIRKDLSGRDRVLTIYP